MWAGTSVIAEWPERSGSFEGRNSKRIRPLEQTNAQEANDGKEIIGPFAPIDCDIARFENAENNQIGYAGRQYARAAVIRGAGQREDESSADF